MNTQQLQSLLENEIPISRPMCFEILDLQIEHVKIKMKLEPNRNHKKTAFGGSLFSGCALAAYSQVLSVLNRNQIATKNIVVADSSIKYKAPLEKDFEIICTWPWPDQQNFLNTFKQKGHAQVWLNCLIYDFGCEPSLDTSKVEFKGRFVIRRE